MSTQKKRIGAVENIPCLRCGLTRHSIRGTYDSRWGDDENDVFGGATHDLLECNGCQRATYRETSWFSEAPGEESVIYWPPRGRDEHVRQPKQFASLGVGTPLESVYRQTITAFNFQLNTLTGAGLRLLVEGVCLNQDINDGPLLDDHGKQRKTKADSLVRKGNLEGKINGLADHGLISKKQAAILHEIRNLGNDAAHALDHPPLTLIEIGLNVVEHLFEQIYEQPEQMKKLAR